MSTVIKSSSELKTPAFLTVNQREEDLAAAELLLAAEKARMLGTRGYTVEEFGQNMREAIDKGAE